MRAFLDRRPVIRGAALRSASTVFTPSLDCVFSTVPNVATAFSYDGTENKIYAYCTRIVGEIPGL